MSKLSVTSFNSRTGSPFKKSKESLAEVKSVVHQEILHNTHYENQKKKQSELMQRVSKKTPEYQANKPSSGVFTEVVTHGAFSVKSTTTDKSTKCETVQSPTKTEGNGAKPLLGFPSSANDLALDAKSDLESDPNISKDVKEKVIEKLFTLVSMVQHMYESKVRIMTEFEKYKDVHIKNESRREKEHSEQLYKLNMNFQNEVVQAIQRLKSEIDISSAVSKGLEDTNDVTNVNETIDLNSFSDKQHHRDKDVTTEDFGKIVFSPNGLSPDIHANIL